MRIVFTGGGTLGPVMPLLALIERLKEKGEGSDSFFWIGTRHGIERFVVSKKNICYAGIFAGKLRRYFDLRNFFDPFLILLGFIQSCFIILWMRPNCIVSAGGYVGVPVIFVGWLFHIKILLLQLDITPSLANCITTPFAYRIFASCSESAKRFPKSKTSITGIPISFTKKSASEKGEILKSTLDIHDTDPVILILGGGTGSQAMNKLVQDSLPELVQKTHVIHITGKGKGLIDTNHTNRYHSFELVTDEMSLYYECADIVVARAGMGTLSILSNLGKVSFIIPLPHSHQEQNASFFEKQKSILYIAEKYLTPHIFVKEIYSLLNDEVRKKMYSENIRKALPQNATDTISEFIEGESKNL